MRIKFEVSEKDYKIIRQIFENYIKSTYYTTDLSYWDGGFNAHGILENDYINVSLCTGNTWEIYKNGNKYYVEYSGSRAGLRALTPFSAKDSWVSENALNIIINDEGKWISLKVVEVKTSNPKLKWSERLERLVEDSKKAVVMTWDNVPLRITKYKNVYKS